MGLALRNPVCWGPPVKEGEEHFWSQAWQAGERGLCRKAAGAGEPLTIPLLTASVSDTCLEPGGGSRVSRTALKSSTRELHRWSDFKRPYGEPTSSQRVLQGPISSMKHCEKGFQGIWQSPGKGTHSRGTQPPSAAAGRGGAVRAERPHGGRGRPRASPHRPHPVSVPVPVPSLRAARAP